MKPVCNDLAGACCTSLSIREMLIDRDFAGKPLSLCFLRVPFLTVLKWDQYSPVLYKNSMVIEPVPVFGQLNQAHGL